MNEGVLIRTGEGREERGRGQWVGKFFKKKEAGVPAYSGPKTNCLYLVRFKTNIG